jgi:acyl-[acyl-carrier-protein]-phospholipid O-acyltransferase / long-chain-fatty-acid--[acyl-carrier-protein] ligase
MNQPKHPYTQFADFRHSMSSSAVQILHQDRLPTTGALVVPARISPAAIPPLLKLFQGRKITWLIEEKSTLDPAIRGLIDQTGQGASFSEDDPALEAIGDQLRPNLADGGVIIYLPGKVAARLAVSCQIPGKTLHALCSLGLPVLPVAEENPRETLLSVESPHRVPEVVVSICSLIQPGPSGAARFREKILEAAEEVFSSKPLLKGSLASAVLAGMKKHGAKYHIHDGADDSELRYDRLLAVALVFSQYIRESTDQSRIGIILPPGKAGLIANIACLFAGKVPVNLNFTAGPEAIRSAINQAGLDRFITADAFVRKFPSFPWPPTRDLIMIERVLPELKKKITVWAVLSKILPTSLISSIFKIGRKKDHDEAVLLFTSGSSGEPKGVSLTHRNILGNVCQFGTRLGQPPNSSILGCLPLFHSFGSTVTVWFPLIEGLNLVTYTSPVETKRLAELIAEQEVHIVITTPTFLRGYMKRATPEQLKSVRLMVTGAEKLPVNLAHAFQEKFGILPVEGYGLTETSPVTNVNLDDPSHAADTLMIPARKLGTVGHPLPGMAIRLTDPLSDEPVTLDQQGVIWFKGANVFEGYLNQPEKSKEVLSDGWFRTGDIGFVDEDGFLHIEGRLSRFSKIAGEMVPHETVEAAINKALGLDQEAERKIAVVGIPDEQKGEAIVLLSTVAGSSLEQECIDLRYKLMDAGLPSLWCPKVILPVSEIPVLASGKLDLKACADLAAR